MILELILVAHVAKVDPFCLKVPRKAWLFPIAMVMQTAEVTYGIKEPQLSQLRACLLKPAPEAK